MEENPKTTCFRPILIEVGSFLRLIESAIHRIHPQNRLREGKDVAAVEQGLAEGRDEVERLASEFDSLRDSEGDDVREVDLESLRARNLDSVDDFEGQPAITDF